MPRLHVRIRVGAFLLVAVVGACSKNAPKPREGTESSALAAAPKPAPAPPLSIDAVLRWRSVYGDLLGKTKDVAIERFGAGFSQPIPGVLEWPASAKTNDRDISVGFDGSSTVFAIKVPATKGESLDPLEILRKAPLFSFETGTFQDSVASYLIATTNDKRNQFQFVVGESGVQFHSAIFVDSENRSLSDVFKK